MITFYYSTDKTFFVVLADGPLANLFILALYPTQQLVLGTMFHYNSKVMGVWKCFIELWRSFS